MSGIYIHIPFCKQACHYCNFHFSTSLKYRDDMVNALLIEIDLRHEYLNDKNVKSIYFGGGTPSLLTELEIEKILNKLRKYYIFDEVIEITLEANPDDMSLDYLSTLKRIGVNRLSVGIQSFNQADLEYMNRAHSAQEATSALEYAKETGFTDFSIDLIYGGHTTSDTIWQQNIEMALSFDPTHISSYCLTIEDGTAFGAWQKSKKLTPIDEEKANRQYLNLQKELDLNGYIHYEISNFAKKGHFAIHNSNYWKGNHYLGIGPAAHSFNTQSRSWNVANNAKYIAALNENRVPVETEILSMTDQYNEFVMTGIRTIWGINSNELLLKFGDNYYQYLMTTITDVSIKDKIINKDGILTLNNEGKNFADQIAASLFYD